MPNMGRQEEEEAQILRWAAMVTPRLETIFEMDSVASAMSDGDLILRVTMKTPLDGRPNARGLLQIFVAREALDDYLLEPHLGSKATEKFLNLMRGRRPTYKPKPSAHSFKTPEPEVWRVTPDDVRV